MAGQPKEKFLSSKDLYIALISAIAGAVCGGLVSLAVSWQVTNHQIEAQRADLTLTLRRDALSQLLVELPTNEDYAGTFDMQKCQKGGYPGSAIVLPSGVNRKRLGGLLARAAAVSDGKLKSDLMKLHLFVSETSYAAKLFFAKVHSHDCFSAVADWQSHIFDLNRDLNQEIEAALKFSDNFWSGKECFARLFSFKPIVAAMVRWILPLSSVESRYGFGVYRIFTFCHTWFWSGLELSTFYEIGKNRRF